MTDTVPSKEEPYSDFWFNVGGMVGIFVMVILIVPVGIVTSLMRDIQDANTKLLFLFILLGYYIGLYLITEKLVRRLKIFCKSTLLKQRLAYESKHKSLT